jgi:hypothetical protein
VGSPQVSVRKHNGKKISLNKFLVPTVRWFAVSNPPVWRGRQFSRLMFSRQRDRFKLLQRIGNNAAADDNLACNAHSLKITGVRRKSISENQPIAPISCRPEWLPKEWKISVS